MSSRKAKIISIVSLKGGVGKTTSVISLGVAMSNLGKRVLLVDGNFSAPNLGLHLKVLDPDVTIQHVLDRKANINDAIYRCGNFDLIPASVFYKAAKNPLKLKDKLKYLKRRYDVILIDSSPSLNNETLASILSADEIVVVATPDYPTLSVSIKAIKTAKQRGIPISGLILNKVHDKDFEISEQDIEETLEIPIMAKIPHDLNILKAVSEFIPSGISRPNSKSSLEFKMLASNLIGEKFSPSIFQRLFTLGGILGPKRQDVNREIYYQSMFN
ncbi:MAG: AAA family ATPase [Nanoarchaeota archaeon]